MVEQKRKRCRRWDEPGHSHALTFSCFRRRKFLDRDRSRQWLVDAIDRARERHCFHVWAYVIMPEHAHLLIHPIEREYSISAVLKTIKQSVARRAVHFVKTEAPAFLCSMEDRQPNGKVAWRFWQRGGGHDRNLFAPAAIWNQIDYIHQNPTRRNLCDRATDWGWSSAADYFEMQPGPLPLDLHSLPDDPRSDAIPG